MALYLHIGLQKTGTTSLQRSLFSDNAALRDAGVLYPSGTAGLGVPDAAAHHFLAHALRDRRFGHTPDVPFSKLSRHCKTLRDLSEAFDGDTIISSEDFSSLKNSQIEKLRSLLPRNTKVVVYLRRQDYWIDSLYGQFIKFGRNLSIDDFLEQQKSKMNYKDLISTWAKFFGPSEIIPRVYEGDIQKNLVRDFFEAIGRTDAVDCISNIRRDNTSLTSQQIYLLDRTQNATSRQDLRRIFENKNQNVDERPGLRHISAEIADQIVQHHKAGNNEIAKKYFGREDLFSDTAPAREKEEERVSFDMLVDLIDVLNADVNRTLYRIKKEIDSIKKGKT